MPMRARVTLFLVGVAAVAVLAVPAVASLPAFGDVDGLVGDALVDLAVEERHAANTVTAIMFDMRAIDTLGEEAILLAAVAGTSLLLRLLRREHEEPADPEPRATPVAQRSPAVRLVGVALIAACTVVGLGLLANGHLSPGGGFQGGVLLAAAVLCIYLLHDYGPFDALTRAEVSEPVEAVGLIGFLAVGVVGLLSSSVLFANVLPLGVLGRLPSAGTIPVLNVLTGVAVGGGIGLILGEFAHQALRVRGE